MLVCVVVDKQVTDLPADLNACLLIVKHRDFGRCQGLGVVVVFSVLKQTLQIRTVRRIIEAGALADARPTVLTVTSEALVARCFEN